MEIFFVEKMEDINHVYFLFNKERERVEYVKNYSAAIKVRRFHINVTKKKWLLNTLFIPSIFELLR
mgnify:CR=1 FL=1